MTIIITIVILILLKFIYDTYLTNNTESRYQDYKSTVYGIRTDGVYMFKQKGTSTWGEKFLITHILIFNTHGLVTYIDLNEADTSQLLSSENKTTFIDNLISEANKISQQENGFVNYKKKGNEIEIKLNGDKYPKKEKWIDRNLGASIFRGSVDHNNLILSYENIYFDETIGQPNINKYFSNQKFTFFTG